MWQQLLVRSPSLPSFSNRDSMLLCFYPLSCFFSLFSLIFPVSTVTSLGWPIPPSFFAPLQLINNSNSTGHHYTPGFSSLPSFLHNTFLRLRFVLFWRELTFVPRLQVLASEAQAETNICVFVLLAFIGTMNHMGLINLLYMNL